MDRFPHAAADELAADEPTADEPTADKLGSDGPLVLASGSPRRRELLDQIGIPWEALAVDVDETPWAHEAPADMVERLARTKAEAGREHAHRGRIVLGADTSVVIDGEALGKPADAAAADAMLTRLAGRDHEVISGVAVATRDGVVTTRVTTRVWLRPIDRRERAAYCASGEPMGKAGGYAIQGLAAVFVRAIEGSYSNVVGLPLFETAQLLAAAGMVPPPLVEAPGSQDGVHG